MNQFWSTKWYGHVLWICLLVVAGLPGCQLATAAQPSQQSGRITGRVTNEQGEPLSGASIRIAGEQRTVAADDEGRFSLVVPPGQYVVTATYVSYATQQQSVTVRDGGS